MSLVKKCVLKFVVWERAFNVRRRRSEPWLWHAATYEGLSGAEKFQVNAFMLSRYEFSVLSKVGCPFGKASLILSLPLTSDSSFLALQVELVCWDKIHSPSIILDAIPSSPMQNTAGWGTELCFDLRFGLKAKWSQRRNSHGFGTSSVQGQWEGYWFW